MEPLTSIFLLLPAVILSNILFIKCQELGKFTKLTFIRPLEDTNHVILRWQYTETDIMFEVFMPTLGIVGLGIVRERDNTDNASVFPADIALGWVQDGLVYLADYHIKEDGSLVVDASQNWNLISGFENNKGTTLRMQRKLDTCDTDDEKITEGSVNLLYAYSMKDVEDFFKPIEFPFPEMGSKRLLLLGSSLPPAKPADDTTTMDFVHNNFELATASDTSYGCTVFYVPKATFGGKYHAIKFEAVFDSEHEEFIHHQFLLGCKLPDDLHPSRFHGETFECAEQSNSLLHYCGYVLFAWGIGMEPFYYPEHMGVSFGGQDDPELFILQSHYHYHTNGQPTDDRDDSSGIRITLTRNIRQYDAGTLLVGHMPSPNHLIPPGEPNFFTSADCPNGCIDWGLGANGTIQIAAVFIHTHERGTSVKVKVIRNGVELPWLRYDRKYSFRHQYTRLLSREFTLQKGDSIRVECTYNTTDDTVVITGGYRRNAEMCIATLIYYPRKSLYTCLSWPLYDQLRNTLNQPIPPQHALNFLSTVNWRHDLIMRRNFRLALNRSAQTCLCTSLDLPERMLFHTFRPVLIRQSYEPPYTCIYPFLLTHH